MQLDSIHCMDIFALCDTLPDNSVDMILCDPPYIPFAPMWEAFRRIAKLRAAIVLTGSQPFTSALVMSWPEGFRYEWIWDKVKVTGHLDAKRRPLKRHESVLIFSVASHSYFPQMTKGNAHILIAQHPTEKPVALFAYLIKTYTQPGELVFDPCVGSGTTAVAAMQTGRHYICGDSDPDYVAIAQQRVQDADPYQATTVSEHIRQLSLFENGED